MVMDVTSEYLLIENEHGETSENIYNLIKQKIFSWDLKPGERINLSKLAKELNVSTIPVREALSRLQESKLVQLIPNRGYLVNDVIDTESMKKMAEFRLTLELEALKIIIRNDKKYIIQKLIATNEKAKAIRIENMKSDIRQFNDLDNEFHKELIRASDNPYIIQSYESLYCHLHIARFYRLRGAVDQVEATREHDEIINAIQTRDLERALNYMSVHIMGGYLRLMENIEEDQK